MRLVSQYVRGRPYFMAQLPPAGLGDRFYTGFYMACRTFKYRDTVALARALGINPRTIDKWKYGLGFPRDVRTAFQIIKWVIEGKPMETMQHQKEML